MGAELRMIAGGRLQWKGDPPERRRAPLWLRGDPGKARVPWTPIAPPDRHATFPSPIRPRATSAPRAVFPVRPRRRALRFDLVAALLLGFIAGVLFVQLAQPGLPAMEPTLQPGGAQPAPWSPPIRRDA